MLLVIHVYKYFRLKLNNINRVNRQFEVVLNIARRKVENRPILIGLFIVLFYKFRQFFPQNLIRNCITEL